MGSKTRVSVTPASETEDKAAGKRLDPTRKCCAVGSHARARGERKEGMGMTWRPPPSAPSVRTKKKRTRERKRGHRMAGKEEEEGELVMVYLVSALRSLRIENCDAEKGKASRGCGTHGPSGHIGRLRLDLVNGRDETQSIVFFWG